MEIAVVATPGVSLCTFFSERRLSGIRSWDSTPGRLSRFSSNKFLYSSGSNWSWRSPSSESSISRNDLSDEVRGKPLRVGGEGPVQIRAGNVEGEKYEVNVCTQRACRRSGSLQTLDVLRSLAPPNVQVDSCGCLGKCGSGPNLVVLPGGLIISHCSTATHAARLLELQCGAADPATNLKALGLKEQGNKAFQVGDLEGAERLYSESIELRPSGGLHFIYGNRSAERLARGDAIGALEDAKEALAIAPMWAAAHLRKADAYVQMGDFLNAQMSCSSALQLDPSLRRSKSFQAKLKQIVEKLELVHANS